MKSTKELAWELGLLRKRSSSTSAVHRLQKTNQLFPYLIVIDFESTCWENKKFQTQEIIEFPAVLMECESGKIVEEFHHYVQPTENPILSDFCKQLTGISQEQVENGIPLNICLSRFTAWLKKIATKYNIIFYSSDSATVKRCTFVTWSDWDLGVCLLYECRRKQLRKPPELNCWIDLRATYRKFYSRKPEGLNGALKDVGIDFEGRQHSGVCDARNTAKLAHRMMADGCIMNITKTLPGGVNICSAPQRATLKRPLNSCAVKNSEDCQTIEKVQESTSKRQKLELSQKSIPSKSDILNDSLDDMLIDIEVHVNSAISPKTTKELSKDKVVLRDCVSSVSHERKRRSIKECVQMIAKKLTPSKMFGYLHKKTQSLLEQKDKSGPNSTLNMVGVSTKHSNENGCQKVLNFHRVSKTSTDSTNEHTTHVEKSVRKGLNDITNKTLQDKSKDNCSFKKPHPIEVNSLPLYKTPVSNPNMSFPFSTSNMKRTPPMCQCGRRSHRKMVQTPGPNVGRIFFSCPLGRKGAGKKSGCGFFKWEDQAYTCSKPECTKQVPNCDNSYGASPALANNTKPKHFSQQIGNFKPLLTGFGNETRSKNNTMKPLLQPNFSFHSLENASNYVIDND